MHNGGTGWGSSNWESNAGLGRRVPSLTQLHDNLEDMVGASLASAIEELSLDAKGKINRSTEDYIERSLHGEATQIGRLEAATTASGASFAPAAQSPEAFSTVETLLKYAQVDASRALIILNVEAVAVEYLVGKSLEFGALKYLETEFQSTFGVVFLAYHDLRAAEAALQGLAVLLRPAPVAVHYCISLDAAVSPKEHTLVVRRVPPTVSDDEVRSTVASFGPLRSLQKDLSEASMGTYTIDFLSSEHAKQAALYMSTSVAWGSGVTVEFAKQAEHDQRSSRQLFALLLHWRRELNAHARSPLPSPHSSPADSPLQQHLYVSRPTPSPMSGSFGVRPLSGQGYYSPVAPSYAARGSGGMPGGRLQLPGHHQYHQQYHHTGGGGGESTFASFADAPSLSFPAPPPRMGVLLGGVGMQQQPPPQHSAGRRRKDSGAESGPAEDGFGLNVNHVLQGFDRRSTLMIRNIPNKYSQTAVLEEINQHFLGSYDFFYLPIDFKNKCNVGYAFINFCDPRSIVPFFCEYNGRRWTNFNSEKVCAISYARIQGKASMISRFQNSSLMEKDGEYRPLLFQSTGPDRGQPEPFPIPAETKPKHGGSRRGASE